MHDTISGFHGQQGTMPWQLGAIGSAAVSPLAAACLAAQTAFGSVLSQLGPQSIGGWPGASPVGGQLAGPQGHAWSSPLAAIAPQLQLAAALGYPGVYGNPLTQLALQGQLGQHGHFAQHGSGQQPFGQQSPLGQPPYFGPQVYGQQPFGMQQPFGAQQPFGVQQPFGMQQPFGPQQQPFQQLLGMQQPFGVPQPFGQQAFGQPGFGQHGFGQQQFGQQPFGQQAFGQQAFGQMNPALAGAYAQRATIPQLAYAG